MLDPIITMNASGFIQSASASVENVFGWTPAELFGRNVKVLIPEPRRSALDRYLDRYRNAGDTRVLERTRRFDAVRKDGKAIQIELSMSRADLPPHVAPYFIGIVREVTSEIDISSESIKDRTRLQQLVTEQTRALATASLRLQLADRLAALGTLAAGLGHDMNNVLLPVRARLNALEHAGIPPAAQTHLKAVRRSVAYLQNLSDGLHDLALDPDGSGLSVVRSGVTDLSRWWRHVGPLISKAIPTHVKLHASFSPGLPPVAIAPHWLTQAMLNLIVNAGEAMPARRTGSWIKLTAKKSEDGRWMRVSVRDNGRGMTQAIQHRAMDLFFTTKPRRIGTGLGLPLARKAVMRAGGDLEIQSKPNHGTTVVLVLGIVAENESREATTEPSRHCAALSLRSGASTAVATQVVISTGLELHITKDNGPGGCDVWITEPTTEALRRAVPWRRADRSRVAVLLGTPAKRLRSKWDTLEPVIIDPPDDSLALRHVLTGLSQQPKGNLSSKPPTTKEPHRAKGAKEPRS
ncbi:MAG: PAS domain S-box protein [Phycisphaerales bacterium]|nr:PAS domain S-box protein [Phycisphaerales bacterium]